MVNYFVLKLYPEKDSPPDKIQASLIKETLEHIGSRLDINLSDFIIENGQIMFSYSRNDCAYDILENIADEIGFHPSAKGLWEETGAARNGHR